MDNNFSQSHNRKIDFWQHHINQSQQSGMSQRRYCQVNELALSTFCYWKRKIGREPEAPIQFYPLVLPNDSSEPDHSGLTLHLKPKRFQIEITKSFSSSTLEKLIKTLEQL